MKRLSAIALLVAFTLAPAGLMAMSHEKHEKMDKDHSMHGEMKGMDHGKMKGMDHDGMAMHGDMAMLGSMTIEGVKASAHLKDVSDAMAKMGMDATHHLMVRFVNEENSAELEVGTVAVKVKGPDGKESDPIKLMGMEGHFGADLTLKEKGEYHFFVGTRLEDGVKRQFHFQTEVK